MNQESSMPTIFGRALVEMGRRDPDLMVLDASRSQATRTVYFAAAFPERFLDVGICEADLFGLAAGLAASGRRPVAVTLASLVGRAWHPLANSICLPALPAVIVATHAGLGAGVEGAARQSLFDVALVRALPHLSVVSPADEQECRGALEAAITASGPVYLRLGVRPVPPVLGPEHPFRLGRGAVLREGSEVALLSTGEILSHVLEAAEVLGREGIEARVVHLSTLKPLDEELVRDSAGRTGAVVTVEEHSVIGGLGSAVAEVLCSGEPVPVERVGVRDHFGECGEPDELLEKFGLGAEGICDAARRVLRRRPSGAGG